MKNLLNKLLCRREEKRLEARREEIASAIAYSEHQIDSHRAHLDKLYAAQQSLDADLLTLSLTARRTGGALARLGVPSCGERH
jgi:hypothetical protein